MTETMRVKARVDGEEQEVTVTFDEEEGYIILTFSDYNATEIRFDWKTIEEISEKAKKSVCASCSKVKCKFPQKGTAIAFFEAGITHLEITVLECENYTKKSKTNQLESEERTMYKIEWTDEDLKEQLKEELEEFKEYLNDDLGEWLRENLRCFRRKLSDEGRP